MNKVYVLFVKKFGTEEEDHYVYLPNYEIHYKPVKGKVAELDVGECVDTYRCTLSGNKEYVNCQLITVSNIDGKAVETPTETFMLAREDKCR